VLAVSNSILDAIKLGIWDFEPESVAGNRYAATEAMPGSDEKLKILAERLERGLPLWHPRDRMEYDTPDSDPVTSGVLRRSIHDALADV
jgi:hypothetical protein